MSLIRLHRDGIDLAIEIPADVTKDVAVIEDEPGVIEIRQIAATRAGRRRFVIGGIAGHVTRERVA